MDCSTKSLFDSLLYSAVSQIESDVNFKKVLIKQIYDLVNNNKYNYNRHTIESNDAFLNDKTLIDRYESMTQLYENCFKYYDNNNNNNNKSTETADEKNISEDKATDSSDSGEQELSSNIKTVYKLVIEYASKKRYDVAIPICTDALKGLQKISDGQLRQHNRSDECRLSEILGVMYWERKQYTESELYLRQALDIRQQNNGSIDRNVIKLKTQLSNVLYEQHRYKQSEQLAKEVLSAIHDIELGFDSSLGNEQCIWELAEEMQDRGHKDYSVVSDGNEPHKHWHRFYDKYPDLTKVLRNLSDIYRKNGKRIAAEVICDMSVELKQDLYGLNDDFCYKIGYQLPKKSPLVRRNTFPMITDNIGCQTEDKPLNTNIPIDKNIRFKNKLFNALGMNGLNNKNFQNLN